MVVRRGALHRLTFNRQRASESSTLRIARRLFDAFGQGVHRVSPDEHRLDLIVAGGRILRWRFRREYRCRHHEGAIAKVSRGPDGQPEPHRRASQHLLGTSFWCSAVLGLQPSWTDYLLVFVGGPLALIAIGLSFRVLRRR